ncbi:uncharacterized protein F4812DRAFT_2526 [Daldinia caldariorum]|uniref:uncharacterized protein n=1 Tax=Daldinia caldariorum TaxID=326644 RepID=UPI002008AF7A|nr:uncharacterized protein F4812DRAFT_2526 [Daldinia caldariorum]KAI1472207.1 hypothetical protein F4812DRAFT_2526 [Daldinia caldariorum]
MKALKAADRPYSPGLANSNPPEKKLSSGFTPLPPIRRTSTFDLLSRNNFDGDDDDETPSPVGSSDNEIPPVPPMKDGINYQPNGNGHMADRAQGGGQVNGQFIRNQNFTHSPPQHHPGFANGFTPAPNGFAAGRSISQPNGSQSQGYVGGGPVALPVHPGHNFASQMEGNPIQKLPPGGQWKLEESRLTEPLIQHKARPGANSPSQQTGYYAYDKETEESPPTRGQGPPQRPRNNSNSIPPVSADRFRNLNLFAPGSQPSHPAPQPQAGPALPPRPNENVSQGLRDGHDVGLNKEADVHVDEVSVSSATSEGQNSTRRGSGFFSLTRRVTGAEQEQQNSNHNNASTKDKAASFLGMSSNHVKYQPNTKSGLASSFDHDDNAEPASMRKRLSELTGMIKGVGNAKDGTKDDQPAKPTGTYVPRPMMQGPMQGPMQSQMQSQMQGPMQGSVRNQIGNQPFQGQAGLYAAPSGMLGRNSPNGPRPPEGQRPQGDEDREKKHGFLGGLFNRQGYKSSETRSESRQPSQLTSPPPQRPPPQFPLQPGQQVRPGQIPPGQQFGPHPMYPGVLAMQPGSLGEQQGVRRPIAPGSGQPDPSDTVQSPTSPQVLETARLVQMRRPSEITVSQNPLTGSPLSPNQRPPTSQGSQAGMRPGTAQDGNVRNFPRQMGADDGFSTSGQLPNDFHAPPRATSFEMSNAGVSSSATRSTPNRKPVASGLSKQDGVSLTSTPTTQNSIQQSTPNPSGGGDSTPGSESPDDEQGLSNHLPSGQQSPTLGKLGHVRQTSFPSPPALTQPGQGTPTSIGSTQFSPQAARPSQDRQILAQSHGDSQGQSSAAGGCPQDQRSSSPWSPNVTFVDQPRAGHLPRPLASTPDQGSTLRKFFGVDPDGESITSVKPAKEAKEKNAAARLLGALRRGNKSESTKVATGRQTPPVLRPGQQTIATNVPRPSVSSANNQPLGPQGMQGPVRSHPPMMHGAGRGQEPQYAQVPIPRGYEAVHGYGQPGMIAPSPYNIGRPSQPPSNQQFPAFVPPSIPQGAPQQWDPRNGPIPQGIQYGPLPAHLQPNHQGLPPQFQQRQADSQSTTPTPSDQGTFLDMAATPPQRPREDNGYDPQSTQGVPPQAIGGPAFHQPPIRLQSNLHQVQTQEAQTPSNSNWGSAAESIRTGQSPRKPGPPIPNGSLHSKPSDPNVSPPSDSDDTQRSPHQHIATAMKGTHAHPQAPQPSASQNTLQFNAGRSFSPIVAQTRVPGFAGQNQMQSPPPIQESVSQGMPNGTGHHLVGKMSTTNLNEPPRNASLSPDVNANRATNVSPEPPAPIRSSPYHQVSNNSLNINVDHANNPKENYGVEDDIYDATPRLNSTVQNQGQYQDQLSIQEPVRAYENTKYAGSEKSRTGSTNGGAVAAAGAGAGIAGGAVGLAVTADTSSIQGSVVEDPSPPQRPIVMNVPAEAEEKIAVDHPVELPAVNVDDDDGMPVMSATSYPGQEWNPYEAGEFGDFDM